MHVIVPEPAGFAINRVCGAFVPLLRLPKVNQTRVKRPCKFDQLLRKLEPHYSRFVWLLERAMQSALAPARWIFFTELLHIHGQGGSQVPSI